MCVRSGTRERRDLDAPGPAPSSRVLLLHWHAVAPGYSGGRGEELTHHERNGRRITDAGRTLDNRPRTSSKSAKGSSLIGDLDRLRATSGIA